LTLDEFEQLTPPFEAAFQAHMAQWGLDGKPRTAPQFAVYKNCPLCPWQSRSSALLVMVFFGGMFVTDFNTSRYHFYSTAVIKIYSQG